MYLLQAASLIDCKLHAFLREVFFLVIRFNWIYSTLFTFTFTFMHLADAFIQSDLHCIQVTVFTFLSALAFPGNYNTVHYNTVAKICHYTSILSQL